MHTKAYNCIVHIYVGKVQGSNKGILLFFVLILWFALHEFFLRQLAGSLSFSHLFVNSCLQGSISSHFVSLAQHHVRWEKDAYDNWTPKMAEN